MMLWRWNRHWRMKVIPGKNSQAHKSIDNLRLAKIKFWKRNFSKNSNINYVVYLERRIIQKIFIYLSFMFKYFEEKICTIFYIKSKFFRWTIQCEMLGHSNFKCTSKCKFQDFPQRKDRVNVWFHNQARNQILRQLSRANKCHISYPLLLW